MAARSLRKSSGRRRLASVLLHIGALSCLAVLIGFIGLATFVLLTYKSYADTLVPPTDLLVNRPSSGAKILDRNGKLLYQYVDDVDGLRQPVKLADVSPAFLASSIATEDANYFSNPGINIKGLVRAGVENFNVKGDEQGVFKGTGGSSITQQLVKNLYVPAADRQKRSMSRKVQEIIYSIELTKRYDKDQILEWYVNQISYGGIYSGVEAASQGYFGKPAKDLTLGEAALLAGIPQSPAAYDPVNNLDAAMARRSEVLDLIARRGTIQIGDNSFYTPTPEEIEEARNAPLQLQQPLFPIEAPHFVLTYVAPELEKLVGRDAVLHDGLVVTTSLDLDLQNTAQDILNGYVDRYQNATNSHNGAIVAIQPGTGQILTMVGSRDYYNDKIQGQVNNALALNSPGSSFKPFVYLTSFMKLGWGPGAIIQDSPVVFRETNGATFQPQNPVINSYMGPVTVRQALGNSLNIPAFKTAVSVGIPDIVAMGRSVGLLGIDGTYGPAIAIGGIDVRPLDLTFAYTVLANGGVLAGEQSVAPRQANERAIDPVAILKITDAAGNSRFDAETVHAEKRIVPPEQAYLISNILSDPSAVCVTFGCGGVNVPGMQVAVKTGTSEPFDPKGPNGLKYGETWAFGYTPDLVVGVWNGNSDNAPISNLFSTTISFPTMRDVMLAAHADHPAPPFVRPPGVFTGRCAPKPAPITAITSRTSGWSQVTSCNDDLVARPGPSIAAAPPPPGAPDAAKGPDVPPTPPPDAPTPVPPAPAGGSFASISAPSGGGPAGSLIALQGSASSPGFQYYKLEIGNGPSPANWSALGQWNRRVDSGALASLSTAGLAPGQYTIRLTVQDATQGPSVATVTIDVR